MCDRPLLYSYKEQLFCTDDRNLFEKVAHSNQSKLEWGMEDLMPDLIERLDRWLRKNQTGYYSQLLPGLTVRQDNRAQEP
jgi:hypothetical protein